MLVFGGGFCGQKDSVRRDGWLAFHVHVLCCFSVDDFHCCRFIVDVFLLTICFVDCFSVGDFLSRVFRWRSFFKVHCCRFNVDDFLLTIFC